MLSIIYGVEGWLVTISISYITEMDHCQGKSVCLCIMNKLDKVILKKIFLMCFEFFELLVSSMKKWYSLFPILRVLLYSDKKKRVKLKLT